MKRVRQHILTGLDRVDQSLCPDPTTDYYTIKFRAYYILHDKDVERFKATNLLKVNKHPGHCYCCCVCKDLSIRNFNLRHGAGVLHEEDTYYLDNKYYVVPESHTRCREVFELAPLGYANWKTSWENMTAQVAIDKRVFEEKSIYSTDKRDELIAGLIYEKLTHDKSWDWDMERAYDAGRLLKDLYS